MNFPLKAGMGAADAPGAALAATTDGESVEVTGGELAVAATQERPNFLGEGEIAAASVDPFDGGGLLDHDEDRTNLDETIELVCEAIPGISTAATDLNSSKETVSACGRPERKQNLSEAGRMLMLCKRSVNKRLTAAARFFCDSVLDETIIEKTFFADRAKAISDERDRLDATDFYYIRPKHLPDMPRALFVDSLSTQPDLKQQLQRDMITSTLDRINAKLSEDSVFGGENPIKECVEPLLAEVRTEHYSVRKSLVDWKRKLDTINKAKQRNRIRVQNLKKSIDEQVRLNTKMKKEHERVLRKRDRIAEKQHGRDEVKIRKMDESQRKRRDGDKHKKDDLTSTRRRLSVNPHGVMPNRTNPPIGENPLYEGIDGGTRSCVELAYHHQQQHRPQPQLGHVTEQKHEPQHLQRQHHQKQEPPQQPQPQLFEYSQLHQPHFQLPAGRSSPSFLLSGSAVRNCGSNSSSSSGNSSSYSGSCGTVSGDVIGGDSLYDSRRRSGRMVGVSSVLNVFPPAVQNFGTSYHQASSSMGGGPFASNDTAVPIHNTHLGSLFVQAQNSLGSARGDKSQSLASQTSPVQPSSVIGRRNDDDKALSNSYSSGTEEQSSSQG